VFPQRAEHPPTVYLGANSSQCSVAFGEAARTGNIGCQETFKRSRNRSSSSQKLSWPEKEEIFFLVDDNLNFPSLLCFCGFSFG